jgi:hypothetical protein
MSRRVTWKCHALPSQRWQLAYKAEEAPLYTTRKSWQMCFDPIEMGSHLNQRLANLAIQVSSTTLLPHRTLRNQGNDLLIYCPCAHCKRVCNSAAACGSMCPSRHDREYAADSPHLRGASYGGMRRKICQNPLQLRNSYHNERVAATVQVNGRRRQCQCCCVHTATAPQECASVLIALQQSEVFAFCSNCRHSCPSKQQSNSPPAFDRERDTRKFYVIINFTNTYKKQFSF